MKEISERVDAGLNFQRLRRQPLMSALWAAGGDMGRKGRCPAPFDGSACSSRTAFARFVNFNRYYLWFKQENFKRRIRIPATREVIRGP